MDIIIGLAELKTGHDNESAEVMDINNETTKATRWK
jgi:hypothetical protein